MEQKKKKGNPIWAILVAFFAGVILTGYFLTKYMAWWQSVMLLNGIFGLVIFELAWKDTYRFRQEDEERDRLFPAFRRLDVQNWRNSKWMFYPGAVTLLPIRAIISLGSFTLCCLCLHVVMLGHDANKPTTGLRDWLRRFLFRSWNSLIPLAAFMSVEFERIDYDYSYYLGKDYR